MSKELRAVTAGLHRLADTLATRDVDDRTEATLLSLAESADGALAEAEQARRALVRLQRRELAEADASIDKIRYAVRVLRAEVRTARRSTKARDAAKQAGPAAVAAVAWRLRSGPVTQKQLVADTGLNVGTVSYALRALMEAGTVETTGQKVGGSRELRMVRGKATAVRALYDRAREVTQVGRTVRR